MKGIIPCCGFGSRMGCKPNESKEMLLDSKGKPLIQYTLDLCKQYNLQPFVVTRKDKIDLNKYLSDNSIPYKIIEPIGEWMNTVLASQGNWDEHNILLLPDVRFEPTQVIEYIKQDLKLGAKVSLGLHQVEDPSKWGIVSNYSISEKPLLPNQSAYAWGIIGFHIDSGESLFKKMQYTGINSKLTDTGFHYLDKFKDLTRTGKIEE